MNVLNLFPCTPLVHKQWFLFLNACEQTKEYSAKVLTVMLWVPREVISWFFVHCAGALLSHIYLWLVQHIVAILKVIQSHCCISRSDAYMVTVIGMSCNGCLIVNVMMTLKASSGDKQNTFECLSLI